MRAFARHAAHCEACEHPYDVHRNGGSLCSKGRQRARDVAQYAFNKAGQTFSVVDLDSNRRVQMEIPADCAVVRELLKAMERGLRLRQKSPAITYDETNRMPPKIIQPSFEHQPAKESRCTHKPALVAPLPPSTIVVKNGRREKPIHYGRGSLYEQDLKERGRRTKKRPVTLYNVGSRGALPVPIKDDYYY